MITMFLSPRLSVVLTASLLATLAGVVEGVSFLSPPEPRSACSHEESVGPQSRHEDSREDYYTVVLTSAATPDPESDHHTVWRLFADTATHVRYIHARELILT